MACSLVWLGGVKTTAGHVAMAGGPASDFWPEDPPASPLPTAHRAQQLDKGGGEPTTALIVYLIEDGGCAPINLATGKQNL